MPGEPPPSRIPGDPRSPVVRGRWFIPTLFLGFLLFSIFMTYGTIWLAQAMQPGIQRRSVEAEKVRAEEEMRQRERAAP